MKGLLITALIVFAIWCWTTAYQKWMEDRA